MNSGISPKNIQISHWISWHKKSKIEKISIFSYLYYSLYIYIYTPICPKNKVTFIIINKVKNLHLFFRIKFNPFKVILFRYNTLMPTFLSIFKKIRIVFLGMTYKARNNSRWISSIDSKRCLRSGFLSLLKSQKSHDAKSGECGSCGTIWVDCFAKTSRTNWMFLKPIETWYVLDTKHLSKWYWLIVFVCQ